MQKTILITGALGGIGTGLCRYFDQQDWRVVGLDVQVKNNTAPHCHLAFDTDLLRLCTDSGYRASQLQQLKEAIGSLHALVNNAAVQRLGHVADLNYTDWQETMHVNVSGPMLLSQAFLPMLTTSQGAIVNISSIHERLTKPGFVAYATSKSALVGLTQAMAVDLQDRVRVNCISPAAVETPMLKAGFADSPQAYETLKSFHPVGKIGTPQEVAELVYFLVSGQARFISGANFQIDGGISKRLHDPV